MKKLVFLFALFTAICTFAQEKPKFQAFAGSKDMLKLGKAEGAVVPFMLQAKGIGWAFAVQGKVVSPGGDASTLYDAYLDGNVVVVVAYISEIAGGSDGKDYQVGMIDAKVYMEDEALETRGVKFKLLPPADDDWAKGMAAEAVSLGAPHKASLWSGSHDVEITRATAVPLDKEALNPKPKPVKKVAPKEETYSEKPVVKKRVAKQEEAEEPVVTKRVVKKKKVTSDDDEKPVTTKKKVVKRKVVEEDEDEGLTIKEKRRRAAARKNAAQYGD